MINFPDNEYFNDVDIAYSDFIQHITSVINKIAPFKEIRIKNYSHDWFDGEILDKIILRDKRLKKFKASRLNIDEQLYKEIKNCTETYQKKRDFYQEVLVSRAAMKSSQNLGFTITTDFQFLSKIG